MALSMLCDGQRVAHREPAHIESWLTMSRVFILQGQIEPGDLNEPNFWILMSQVG